LKRCFFWKKSGHFYAVRQGFVGVGGVPLTFFIRAVVSGRLALLIRQMAI
jgi:hypothetical protein